MLRLLLLSLTFLGLAGCAGSSFSGSSGSKKDPPPKTKPDKTDNLVSGDAEEMGTSAAGTPTESTSDDPMEGPEPQTDDAVAANPAAAQQGNDPLSPVDSGCANGASGGIAGFGAIAPKNAPMPQTLPAGCTQGVELNNYKGTFALTSSGSKALTLEIDLASYAAADRMRLISVGDDGERVILDSCRLRTAPYFDPTGGTRRPPEDAVREYRVALPAGTRQLKFDFSGASTPTYMRVLGLCDFARDQPSVQGGNAPTLRQATR